MGLLLARTLTHRRTGSTQRRNILSRNRRSFNPRRRSLWVSGTLRRIQVQTLSHHRTIPVKLRSVLRHMALSAKLRRPAKTQQYIHRRKSTCFKGNRSKHRTTLPLRCILQPKMRTTNANLLCPWSYRSFLMDRTDLYFITLSSWLLHPGYSRADALVPSLHEIANLVDQMLKIREERWPSQSEQSEPQ